MLLMFLVQNQAIPQKVLGKQAWFFLDAWSRFYRQEDLDETGLEEYRRLRGGKLPSKIFPVSLHPNYGGWFGLRGVLLFRSVCASESLEIRGPPEVLTSQKQVADLLYLFNEHWQDRRYRNVGMPNHVERYSDLQQEYFAAASNERTQILERVLKRSR